MALAWNAGWEKSLRGSNPLSSANFVSRDMRLGQGAHGPPAHGSRPHTLGAAVAPCRHRRCSFGHDMESTDRHARMQGNEDLAEVGMNVYYLLGTLFAILCLRWCRRIAISKNREPLPFAVLGVLLGPIGVIIALAVQPLPYQGMRGDPDRGTPARFRGTPAGWYDSSVQPGHLQYWDGGQWQNRFHPRAAGAPPVP